MKQEASYVGQRIILWIFVWQFLKKWLLLLDLFLFIAIFPVFMEFQQLTV